MTYENDVLHLPPDDRAICAWALMLAAADLSFPEGRVAFDRVPGEVRF